MKSCWNITIVVGLLSCAGSTSGSILSGPAINPTNGHAYYLLSAQSWTGAESEAVSLSGHLATINDLAENEWVATQFHQPFGTMWIGLNDAQIEGTYVWASGESSAYRNWYGGAPAVSQPDADYIAINFERFNQWIPYQNGSDTFGASVGVAEVLPEPAAATSVLLAGCLSLRRRRRTAMIAPPGAKHCPPLRAKIAGGPAGRYFPPSFSGLTLAAAQQS